MAASAYRLANALLPAGRIVEAKEVALSAAGGLERRLDASPAHLATWGGLILTAAVAAARQGDGGEAWELVGEAKTAARRLGTEHADLHTIFGPTSLAIQGVQVAAELGDSREVLRRARFVEPTRLPPYLLERRTHLLSTLLVATPTELMTRLRSRHSRRRSSWLLRKYAQPSRI